MTTGSLRPASPCRRPWANRNRDAGRTSIRHDDGSYRVVGCEPWTTEIVVSDQDRATGIEERSIVADKAGSAATSC